MTDYDSDFWTEAVMLRQRAALMNIIHNPAKFPRADMDRVGDDLEALDFAMMRRHPTVAVLRAITGQ
jgi:hypothetical protein